MEGWQTLFAFALFVGVAFSLRIAGRHLRNLIGYRSQVAQSLEALSRGKLPPHPGVLASHMQRAAERGPAAVSEKLRWDWVGMLAVAVTVTVVLTALGVWIWP